MNDVQLQSLGFATTAPEQRSIPARLGRAGRYQHEYAAGTLLFIEHALGIPGCRLGTPAGSIGAPLSCLTVARNKPPGNRIQNCKAAPAPAGAALHLHLALGYRPHRPGAAGGSLEVPGSNRYL